jgi:hypothetical protein
MAVNKLISIKVPVLEALQDMGIDHAKYIPDFIRWAARAENIIGSYYSYRRKIKRIKVDKYRAELPCDAKFVQRIVLGDHECKTYDLYNTICGMTQQLNFQEDSNTGFVVVDKPDGQIDLQFGHFKWEVQDNHIILSADYDKQYITVQYLGLQEDSEGLPMVMENHIEAIVDFIMLRVAKRSRFSPQKMDLGDVQMLERSFRDNASAARSDDAEISEADRDEIVAMITDPLSGYGMQVQFDDGYLYNGY